MKVGVLLAREPGDLSGWLATAVAFDVAGADVLWVDVPPDPELDPWTLTAALAAVTSRSLLVVPTPPPDPRVLATVRRLSRGRLAEAFRPVPGDPGVLEHAGERWATTDVPANRAAWQETIHEAAARGTHGLLVPVAPNLLDLLRNPEPPEARRDLDLAMG
ncbi:MAG TPA: hypothetical protein VFC00_34475 [Micromonosporaceae bacterium]|nr:hypothetical protein [Micromonosporaceae bacterium]